MMFVGLGSMVTDLVSQAKVPQDVAGPLGIAKLTGQVAKQGFYQLLEFMALISLNLAIVNILPFPALDGGRIFFVLLETILNRRINPKVEQWAHSIGMILLLILIATITVYDYIRFF